MSSDLSQLPLCRQLIEQKLDWGPSDTWSSVDFEQLQQGILDETGVSLSVSTLRRIWGRVDYAHLPSTTTLNTLARFAGYSDWRQFIRSTEAKVDSTNSVESSGIRPIKRFINWRRIGWIAGISSVLALGGIITYDRNPRLPSTPYRLSSRSLTRTIPNSVIFTYDASASPIDSVFIQQSWDPHRRTQVSRDGHTHTSIYYEPGFYQAKLVVGHQVMSEHSLLIPTTNWLGTITTASVPIYLKPSEFIQSTQLSVSTKTVQAKNVPLQPKPSLINYTNIGNFKPIPLRQFSFTSLVRNDYSEGAAACQLSWVILVTDAMPIAIPLSTKGCVSELTLLDGSRVVSGKQTDLSAFGVDFTNWVTVSGRSDGRTLSFFVNNQLAYTTALPLLTMKIIGVKYMFQGAGSVKNIVLKNADKLAYQAFTHDTPVRF